MMAVLLEIAGKLPFAGVKSAAFSTSQVEKSQIVKHRSLKIIACVGFGVCLLKLETYEEWNLKRLFAIMSGF
jgi:hypothetical protein